MYVIQLLILLQLLQFCDITIVRPTDFTGIPRQAVTTTSSAIAQSAASVTSVGPTDARLVFRSYGMEDIPTPEEAQTIMELLIPELEPLSRYIAAVNPRVDADEAASVLCVAAAEQGVDPWLLAAVARFESHFDIHAVGGAGELGPLQVHPCHEPRFAAAGCVWGDPLDCTRFGAMMLGTSLKKGLTLHAALRPWAVRADAEREYARMERATGTGLVREGGALHSDDEEEGEE